MNVLVCAHRKEAPEHTAALERVRQLAEGRDRWALPWPLPCVCEFLGVTTNMRIWKEKASTQAQAWSQIAAWSESPDVTMLSETDDLVDVLETFVCRDRVRGPIVHDARIAALCVAHGIEALLSRDRDFSLLPELISIDPFS